MEITLTVLILYGFACAVAPFVGYCSVTAILKLLDK